MTILSLLGNIWVRRAALVVAAVLAFFFLRQHFINEGKDQGHATAGQELKAETKQEIDQARADYLTKLDQQNQIISNYQNQLAVSQELVQRSADIVAGLKADRQKAADALNKVPDSQLHGFITSTLKIRRPDDTTPGYLPQEERAIATCVQDEPKVQQENDAQGEQIKGLQDSVNQLKGEVAAVQQSQKDLAQYTGVVEHAYVEIYNAFPRKSNRLLEVVTFGLAGKTKPLPFPSPADLSAQKKK